MRNIEEGKGKKCQREENGEQRGMSIKQEKQENEYGRRIEGIDNKARSNKRTQIKREGKMRNMDEERRSVQQ